jgi:glycosyltransferase involved in cell wall biosynthesis
MAESTLDENLAAVPAPVLPGTAAVVVTTFNHARFLGDALASVSAQTRPSDETIVVDDGSTDNPGQVVARFPGVRLVRQPSQGLAAARNTGLSAVTSQYVVFLDADDRLDARALEVGLRSFARHPDCGFVYGGHRHIAEDGRRLRQRFEPPGIDAYAGLLRTNFIAMHGAVMYHRDRLRAVGGFDPALRCCEDYDAYLRMSRLYPVWGCADVVAEYRQHGRNMSGDRRAMLGCALAVHRRHEAAAGTDPVRRAAWLAGRTRWRRHYADEVAESLRDRRRRGAGVRDAIGLFTELLLISPRRAWEEAAFTMGNRLLALLPARVAAYLDRRSGRAGVPAVDRVRFGDLRRVTPISREFGFDRGRPVDRYYIERFLAAHAADIAGRVLEVGDDTYTQRYGGPRVARADVLHVHAGNPRATLVGDLTVPGVLPENAFDCIVFTQTLHLIYDLHAAADRLYRALAPSGVLLLTVPGITPVDRGEWGSTWFWSFTAPAVERLFGRLFGAEKIQVETHGNVLAATAFVQGLAAEELTLKELDVQDAAYPVTIALRAVKKG